jgi:tRNA-binding protein
LLGRQVVCVLGFGVKRIAGFSSEVLVLGAYSAEHGVVLLKPDREVEPGSSIG